jgi:hypothetical protein
MLRYDRLPAYFGPDLAELEKQRGKLGMTWRFKVQSLVFTLILMAALALAAGATWVDAVAGLDW